MAVVVTYPGHAATRLSPPEPMLIIGWCGPCEGEVDMTAEPPGIDVICVAGHPQPGVQAELLEDR